jgi:hypothetical protein
VTTYFPFQPTPAGAVQFGPVFDGNPYAAIVTWNLFGARWYLSLYAGNGVRVFTLPVVESPAGAILQALSWSLGRVSAVTAAPHGYAVGATVQLNVAGCLPDAYNGEVTTFITGPTTFTYPLGADPGQATQFGSASFDVNLAEGYFASSLVFRNGQFAVSP